MKRYRIAILGASGAVGREMLKVLEERSLPIASLKLLASRRSAGKTLLFQGRPLTIEEADEHSFDDVDIVLGAAENDVARRFVPIAVAKGAVVIDNSSAYRLDEEVPLVIPEVNAADAFAHHGIIAKPFRLSFFSLPWRFESAAQRLAHPYAHSRPVRRQRAFRL